MCPQQLDLAHYPLSTSLSNFIFNCLAVQIEQGILVSFNSPTVMAFEGGALGEFDPVCNFYGSNELADGEF